MIDAYKAGYPDKGKPFPDGAKMAKVHWTAKVDVGEPGAPTVPGPQHDVDFMLKASRCRYRRCSTSRKACLSGELRSA
jgi:hypothetical protein